MEPAVPSDTRRSAYWPQLLQKVADGAVVPIVGRDLLKVTTGDTTANLYQIIARRLAEVLGVEVDGSALAAGNPLNTVACRYIIDGGDPDLIYSSLWDIVPGLMEVPVPAALAQLVAIPKFNLFVTTTFDGLLERAVQQARGSAPQVLAYSARNQMGAAPGPETQPTVYHVFGRVSPLPDYVVTDEDALEFMFSLQASRTQPVAMLQRLWASNLLIVGCSFPSWAVRFFLRLAREKRLLFADRERIAYVVDPEAARDAGLLQFLKAFRTRVEVISDYSAEEFCAELSRRWTTLAQQAPADVPERESVFVSYASEDRPRVEPLVADLRKRGFTVWFDQQSLGPGDPWRELIRQGIRQCAAFIPVLSRESVQRSGREYWLEWTRAAEWSGAMAADDRFLFPVAIDDVPAETASLPPKFRDVNWTRITTGTIPDELALRLSEARRRKKMGERR